MGGHEFLFRIWVHPEDGDPPEVETWCQELVPTGGGSRSIAEWAEEALQYQDFHDLFGLDKEKHWQVVGKARVTGSCDYWGEYDEELDLLSFKKAEVAETFFEPVHHVLHGKNEERRLGTTQLREDKEMATITVSDYKGEVYIGVIWGPEHEKWKLANLGVVFEGWNEQHEGWNCTVTADVLEKINPLWGDWTWSLIVYRLGRD